MSTEYEDDDDAAAVPPSRTQQRAERKQVQADLDALAKRLAGMNQKALGTLDLDPALTAAVRELATMSRGPALARQRRHTSRLLRAYDFADLARRVEALLGNHTSTTRASTLERWRSRLLEEGDAALAELLDAHPAIDRVRLRQAVRAAVTEQAKGTPGRRFKALYKLLSEALP